jgi:L-rhamnose isomerase
MSFPRISTHLAPFSSGIDRFATAGYHPETDGEARILQAASIQGLDGIELNFRSSLSEGNAGCIKDLLEEVNLVCSNVSMNVWGHASWKNGSLSNPDARIRSEAIDLIVSGMAAARSIGSPLVSIWPGQDGFDYPFSMDYRKQMDHFVEGLRTCADAVPDMRICIEYKPKEPRSFSLVDSAARCMWMIARVDRPNVGVLLDVGHALFARENAAQTAVLLHNENLLDLIHFNDNYGDWDWDMVPGTIRFYEMLELVFWLQEVGYSGFYSIDIVSPRSPAVEAVQLSVENIQRMYRAASLLDRDCMYANLYGKNPIANMKFLSDRVFRAFGK